MPSWNSASTSSTASSSSERFNLDDKDTRDILVYRYRQGLKGVDVESQQKLCRFLDKEDPQGTKWRVSRKKIPRGNSRVDVRMEDLFTDAERLEYSHFPSAKNSLASVGLPSLAKWKHALFNSFPVLYIVSPVSSPENSINNSPESSQHVTPRHTFGKHVEQESKKASDATEAAETNKP